MSDPVEDKILEFFDQNYERLKLEGGHALTEDVKAQAKQQVLWYWRKLKDLAHKISDAEVRLSLPNQKTPQGRTFSIDGVVDIVKEGNTNHMYDIKTHDLDYVLHNKDIYEEQLNVYAYVWQELRKNKLDFTAIISTSFPEIVKMALRRGTPDQLKKAVDGWDPVVPIAVDQDKVKDTIRAFGKVVDAIEEGEFPCRSITELLEKTGNRGEIFATSTCRNCDGRFSCSSYQEYARVSTKGKSREQTKYFKPSLSGDEQEDWLEANSNPKS